MLPGYLTTFTNTIRLFTLCTVVGPLPLLVRRDDQVLRTVVVGDDGLLLEYPQVLDVLEEALVRGEELGALDVLLELLHVALELGPPVLEPGDDLGVGQAQRGGDLVAVRRTEVLLVEEPLLQLEDLVVGEGRPRLSLLLGLLARVEQVEVVLAVCGRKTD
jgi:hypothetical protein